MAEQYVIMEDHQFIVYSIDTKVINIDKSRNVEKRTEVPLSLRDAVSKATELESQGHVIMLERVS